MTTKTKTKTATKHKCAWGWRCADCSQVTLEYRRTRPAKCANRTSVAFTDYVRVYAGSPRATVTPTVTPPRQAYSVRPFSGARYHENSRKTGAGSEACAICGKPTKTDAAKHWAIVVDGGASWGDESSDEKDPGYMGSFPIGNDCHRRYAVKG